jgi:hypothetical protein
MVGFKRVVRPELRRKTGPALLCASLPLRFPYPDHGPRLGREKSISMGARPLMRAAGPRTLVYAKSQPRLLPNFVSLRLRPADPQPAVARSNGALQCNPHTYMFKSARARE